MLEIVMLRVRRSLVAATFALLLASPASALTLGLPDVVSGFIDVTYDSTTDTFTATGFSLEIDDDGVAPNVALDASGGFSVVATIDDTGTLVSGTVSVTGTQTVPLGYVSGTLAAGSITSFSWSGDASGIVFEFGFTFSSGDLASPGTAGGVILATTLNSFSGFGSDFDNLLFAIPGTGAGTSDTAPIVPEPATALLVACSLGLAVRRLR
ncbi:MAG: hypothetical protein R3246_16390 [Acidimicrobiia bacterium]|nr:hypothetical protein [Acidimicrobiia bacterium]